jgi:hypothetical protein
MKTLFVTLGLALIVLLTKEEKYEIYCEYCGGNHHWSGCGTLCNPPTEGGCELRG